MHHPRIPHRPALLCLASIALLLLPALTHATDDASIVKMVRDGEIKNLQLLLLESGQVDRIRDDDGNPLLHLAVKRGRPEVVTWLIQQHANVNQFDSAGHSALYDAFDMNNLDIINLLVNNQADVHELEEGHQMTVLHRAAENSPSSVITAMLALKLDINAVDSQKRTPLHIAAYHGNVDAARTLIEAGAQIGVEDEDGETPLAVAADHYSNGTEDDRYKIAEMLLNSGADANQATSWGRLPQTRTRSWSMYFLLAEHTPGFKIRIAVALISATILSLIPLLVWRSVAKNNPVKART